ncbi:MAG: alanine--tRNA ligase, partial [Candidatus Saccharibacteria bacterium]
MTAQEIRAAYLKFFEDRGHKQIPRALLVPQNDPTTLFTGSGMQPLIPYLLGEPHPDGNRLTDSQTCLRAQDIEEIGDNRHTTFFEMLGNWSLGDYFKKEQINWFWEFVTKEIGLDPERIFVSCYIGNDSAGIPKDTESADIWSEIFGAANVDARQVDIGSEEDGYRLGEQGGRIFFYSDKNWWSREGAPSKMSAGEPGGPDTEMFYLFPEIPHNQDYGEKCHVNCDCGRYIELGNSVFMEYLKTDPGFDKLPKKNVDYGGGLERIAAAAMDSPDVYRISLLWPIVEKLERLSNKKYDANTNAMRVIADHLRGATFLAVDGIVPSNKEQGYVMRRLIRRAIRFAFELGVEQNFLEQVVPVIVDLYKDDLPEVASSRDKVIEVLVKEEKAFRQTLRKGLQQFDKVISANNELSGATVFELYDTYGFPTELSTEEAYKRDVKLSDSWQKDFEAKMLEQRERSRTATKGEFKGGLGGHTETHKKYHTATHLMYESLRRVLGDHVIQHGSNITEERLRFDFSHPEKMTPEQIKQVEDMVNDQIAKDLKVTWEEHPTKEAIEDLHVLGAFGDRYGEIVKVYRMQAEGEDKPYSLEICGGPHVEHAGQLAEGGKKFKIIKEESSSSGIRRIKAVLE